MTKAENIARRWQESEKGLTPHREAKAKAAARRLKVSWDDVQDAVTKLQAEKADAHSREA